MTWIFWLSVGVVAYTLAGYPTLLWIVSRFRRQAHRQASILPSVSIIVVAYNAQYNIEGRIRNLLEIDYPKDNIEIIAGSDGSTDETANVIRSFEGAGVKLVESRERKGKHHIQMLAREVARGDILVFTDASIRTEAGVIRRMVSHFADPQIGAVCSVDVVGEPRKGWKGEHFYVYGEMGLRRLEAHIGSLVSLSGALFGVRREICEGWHPDMSSDFFLALHTVEHGYRAILDPECQAHLGFVKSQKAELTRKVRTIVHGLVVFFSHLNLLNPFRYGLFAWQLASHKLFRWLLPFPVMMVLISNAFLWKQGLIYQISLIAQLLGYSMGLASYFDQRLARLTLFKLAHFFVLGNMATLVAWWKFIQGDKIVLWEPSQRS